MAAPRTIALKKALEMAFQDYHHEKRVMADPISLVYPFTRPEDQEIIAFMVALISYGNVNMILKSGAKMLGPLGNNPFDYLVSNSSLELWKNFKHRFTTGDDIEILMHWLREVLKTHGSLERFFIKSSPSQTACMKEKLSSFVKGLWSQRLPNRLHTKFATRQRNLRYLVSDPEQGSACKRLNMFLRWVVRPKDGVDLGLWNAVSPKELMLPLDTHIIQTLQRLGWIRSKNANWKTVELVTKKLRTISLEDPIRYDFALCHLSMAGGRFEDYKKIDHSMRT